VDDLRNRLNEIPKNKKIVVTCAVGLRGYLATRILLQNGFADVSNLSGGYKTYEAANAHQSNDGAHTEEKSMNPQDVDTQLPRTAGVLYTADACGLQCPGPIIRLKNEMDKLKTGDHLEMTASDQGFKKDAGAWCAMTGNKLVSIGEKDGVIHAVIEKGSGAPAAGTQNLSNKTIVVFSDDLDRALASFVIANGATSTGKKVTMFFTFWGLNILKKRKHAPVKKDFMGKMFGMMMAKDSRGTKLSKLNMLGIGSWMMRRRMKAKNVDSLESMMAMARAAGVTFIACQMSMDIMGVKAEELIDGAQIGGVATYLSEAEQANVNLFI
jgi:peroxiredoxin family protein/TusA-related sulfurtransferase